LFPTMPYHNLGLAHRRLMEHLPAQAAYRRVVFPSYWSVLRHLLAQIRGNRSAANYPGKLQGLGRAESCASCADTGHHWS
jgi:fatty acid desaturase